MRSAPFFFIWSGTAIAAKSFDYIIVGAGTSGLVVANRLSEDPSVTVAVIEPGTDQRSNPNVTAPENFTKAFGTSIDWQYKSTAQPGANGQQVILHQGKAWGGCSAINGMTYIRGDAAHFDAWEAIGNPGWNWATLLPYYKKSEQYTIPSASAIAAGVTYQSKYHGFDGPLHVGYVPSLVDGNFSKPAAQTWKGMSFPHNPDLNSGNVRGWSLGPQTLDSKSNLRWDSFRAYYLPVEGRPNLKIVQGTVKRITWAAKKGKGYSPRPGRAVANGVEFVTVDGSLSILHAKREVIVSAGAVRTPLVLEGSGIGNPRRLESLGIPTTVDLPGVGENLIEQPSHFLAYLGSLDGAASAFHTFATVHDLFGKSVSAIAASARASIPKWANLVAQASGGSDALSVNAVKKLLTVQYDLLFKQNVTAAEVITVYAPGGILASNYAIMHPFTRGSVHLKSKNEIDEPLFDPRFFLADFDMNAAMATGKLAQRFWLSEPMKNFVLAPLLPGAEILPDNATDEQWDSYLRQTVNSESHPLGSASMMSRELGGVVDPELRVYGTANVRVVDASVLPLQISGHLTATLYAVAERASDIIKRTWH